MFWHACDATIQTQESFYSNLGTKVQVHDIFPWLVVEIKHTFTRILAACLILFLNDCNANFKFVISNTTFLLLFQFIFTLTLRPDDLNDIETSLASNVEASIFHLAKVAASKACDLWTLGCRCLAELVYSSYLGFLGYLLE